MKLLPIARSAAASALLVFVLTASLLGATCEARCIHPADVHSCCPILNPISHSNANIAGKAICLRPANVISADLVPPAGLVAGAAVFTPREPALFRSASETHLQPLTASPPKFHLRI
ncbi:MAG: hypothetical protein WA419_20015 [Silvibacterium sp.]